MLPLFSQITFLHPAILAALLALPLLWYILRITPPAPKTIFFPATRFLVGLNSEENTPQKSPWWILLLRLLIAGLIIIALARPVINSADSLPGQSALRLIIDNSWASAQSWETQIDAAKEAVTQAGRENRDIYILPTTPVLGEKKPTQYGALSSGEALSILRGLTPNSWPSDYDALLDVIQNHQSKTSLYTLWLSHGLNEGKLDPLIEELQHQGGLGFVIPKPDKMPLLLRQSHKNNIGKKQGQLQDNNIRIDIDTVNSIAINTPFSVQAIAEDSTILDINAGTLSPDDLPKTLSFDIPERQQNSIAQFRITGRKGAGGIFLLDDQFKKRKVGIVAEENSDSNATLSEDSYYIGRAIEPFAYVSIGNPQHLIDDEVSVIILPDIAAMPADTLNTLETWVKNGGLLLRFAGEKMSQERGAQFLLPVLLRSGERSLSGSLSWSEPQTIAPFAENSPFYGLPINDKITIQQQVLADPSQDLEGKVWATLSDGTPFITTASEDKGLIVLIHTTANTNWSDFALSGLYVSVLKRIIQLAGHSAQSINSNNATLDPILIMDGFGGLLPPSAAVKPLDTDALAKTIPNSTHPPGLYGNAHAQYALNIGTHLPALRAIENLPLGITLNHYDTDYEIDVMPYILYGALLLFCLDWMIMIFLIGSRFSVIKKISLKTIIVFLFSLTLTMMPLLGHANDEQDLKFSKGFYLAYIQTGDEALDALTQRGLETLSETLIQRTSIEPVGVAGLNPDNDTLAFFPIIYWAMSDTQQNYTDRAIHNIQFYIDHGGTIIFDTRDQNRSIQATEESPNAAALRRITASLDIPPIAPIPNDHVLGRSFYLLSDYPGRYSTGTIWVEQQSVSGRDNVSSVIIGSNDWAGSWADSYGQAPFSRYQDGHDSQQREMALRFGVNLVMYAMTGNYKADQLHISHILERLGQ